LLLRPPQERRQLQAEPGIDLLDDAVDPAAQEPARPRHQEMADQGEAGKQADQETVMAFPVTLALDIAFEEPAEDAPEIVAEGPDIPRARKSRACIVV